MKRTVRVLTLALLSSAPLARAADAPTTLDTTIELEKFTTVDYSKTATGLGEGQPRATISLPAVDIAVMPAGQNPIILLGKTPGVNVQSSDNIGLYEHANRVQIRSFNINQIAVTLDDVPMGQQNFYGGTPVDRLIDSESVERVDVSTGIGAVWMPATASLGGAMRYYTKAPKPEASVAFAQSFGDNEFQRSFIRLDSGPIADSDLSTYVSYSTLKARKWRGIGTIYRNHVGGQVLYAPASGHVFRLKADYNARGDFDYRSMSKAIFEANGRYYEYSTSVTGDPAQDAAYWDNQFNYRRDLVVSLDAKLKLTENVDLSLVPYYDKKYIRGGANQNGLTGAPLASYQLSLTSTPGNLTRMVHGQAFTITAPKGVLFSERPADQLRKGVPVKLDVKLGAHTLSTGVWYQNDYYHRADIRWNREGGRAGGRNLLNEFVYGNHDVYHRFYTTQVHLEDQVRLAGDTLLLTVGAKSLSIEDKFEGIKNATDYSTNTYSKFAAKYEDNFIPSAGIVYDLTPSTQVFTSYAENMAQPVKEVYYADNYPAKTVKAETSRIVEAGWRSSQQSYNYTLGGYIVKYSNRLYSFADFDPTFARTVSSFNDVGGITSKGLEASFAYFPVKGLRFSHSATYNSTTFDSDYTRRTSATASVVVPTAGKVVPDFPKFMFNSELNYAWKGLYIGVDARTLSRRYSTPTNTEWLGGYTVYGTTMGYQAPGSGKFGRLRLQFNVSNVMDKVYLGTISPGDTAGSFQPGAPRTMYFAVSSEF